jgi:hypothetical protein
MEHPRITVTPTTRLLATAIMDMGHMGHMGPHTGLHMRLRLTPSQIALDASAPTILQARPIFRTAVSVFPARSGPMERAVE